MYISPSEGTRQKIDRMCGPNMLYFVYFSQWGHSTKNWPYVWPKFAIFCIFLPVRALDKKLTVCVAQICYILYISPSEGTRQKIDRMCGPNIGAHNWNPIIAHIKIRKIEPLQCNSLDFLSKSLIFWTIYLNRSKLVWLEFFILTMQSVFFVTNIKP